MIKCLFHHNQGQVFKPKEDILPGPMQEDFYLIICLCAVLSTHYTVEYGNNVTLDVSAGKESELKQVYVTFQRKEDFKLTDSSLLQITDVKLRDAGDYRCLIEYGELTTKQSPETPYRIITPGAVSTGHNEWKLTCQSEGYPEAEVIWQNRDYEDLSDKANTRYESGSDQLYLVTSTLTIKSGIDEIFYCTFWNKELQENTSAILHIAGNISQFCLLRKQVIFEGKLGFNRKSVIKGDHLSFASGLTW
uniref:Ig-like domain-containing protein n=1 Tax=Malurus cyaneus samueli TaxID=2593467 RepID=A0A8C5TRP5_9PASS